MKITMAGNLENLTGLDGMNLDHTINDGSDSIVHSTVAEGHTIVVNDQCIIASDHSVTMINSFLEI